MVAVPPCPACLFGAASESSGKKSRDGDVARGLAWARNLVRLPAAPTAWLAGEYDPGPGVTIRIVIVPIVGHLGSGCSVLARRSADGPPVGWLLGAEVDGHHAAITVAEAVARAASFVRPSAVGPRMLRVGRGALMAVTGAQAAPAAQAAFDARLERSALLVASFSTALLRRAGECADEGKAAFYRCLSERVLPVPIGEIPDSLRGGVELFDDAALDLAPFRHEARIPRTNPPRPEAAGYGPVSFPPELTPPRCHLDVLEAWCFDAASDTLDAFDAWHVASTDAPRPTKRPEGGVWGLSGVRPEWRPFFEAGGVIDFTVDPPAPLGPASALRSHIREDFAASVFADSPDAATTSVWQQGCMAFLPERYISRDGSRSDVAMLALAPNLMSTYPDAALPIARQVALFEARQPDGWVRRAAHARSRAQGRLGACTLPFCCAPTGGVAKRGTPEPRVIVNLGWPPAPLPFRTAPGDSSPPALYHSVNASSGYGACRHEPAPPGAPAHEDYFCGETKPTIRGAIHNTCVLGRGCLLGGLDLLEIGLDFLKWFHQIKYWWRLLARMGAIIPTEEHGRLRAELTAVMNLVTAMGWTFASEVAQRAGNQIVSSLLRALDRAELPSRAAELQPLQDWLEARAQLPHDDYGAQDRLYDAAIFTDDPRISVATSPETAPGGRFARPLRLLDALFDLIGPEGLNLILAKHSKWIGSVWSKWIGCNFCPTLGLVWVSPDKALRAASELTAFIAASLTLADLVSLLGFLNHLAEIFGVHPYLTRHLWVAHDRHVRDGAAVADCVAPLASEVSAAEQWRRIVTNTPGTTMMRARSGRQPPYGAVAGWPVRSDACFDIRRIETPRGVRVAAAEGHAPPGMGGDHHGTGWAHVFTEAELQVFTIPTAELAASILHLYFVEPLVPDAANLIMEIDALASPRVLADRARSPGMVAVHEEFLASDIFQRMMLPRQRLATRQIFGAGNPGGDLRSRSRHEEADALARQLAQEPRLLPLPAEATAFLQRVFARLRELRRDEPGHFDPAAPGGTAVRFRGGADRRAVR